MSCSLAVQFTVCSTCFQWDLIWVILLSMRAFPYKVHGCRKLFCHSSPSEARSTCEWPCRRIFGLGASVCRIECRTWSLALGCRRVDVLVLDIAVSFSILCPAFQPMTLPGIHCRSSFKEGKCEKQRSSLCVRLCPKPCQSPSSSEICCLLKDSLGVEPLRSWQLGPLLSKEYQEALRSLGGFFGYCILHRDGLYLKYAFLL